MNFYGYILVIGIFVGIIYVKVGYSQNSKIKVFGGLVMFGGCLSGGCFGLPSADFPNGNPNMLYLGISGLIIGLIIILLSNKLTKGTKELVEQEIKSNFITIHPTLGPNIKINKNQLKDISYYEKLTKNGGVYYIRYTYEDDYKNIISKEEKVSCKMKSFSIFLNLYKNLPYKSLNNDNYITLFSTLKKERYNIQDKIKSSDFQKYISKIKNFESNYNDFCRKIFNTPSYTSKPIDPYIAAGIANGIAGAGAAILTGLEQKEKMANWEKNKSEFQKSQIVLDSIRNRLFDSYKIVENIINESDSAKKYWEEVKENMYDEELKHFIIK